MSQKKQILNLLQENEWVCTSQMYALFIADPRRRLVDLKEDGFSLEGKKCKIHFYHKGVTKMWRLVQEKPKWEIEMDEWREKQRAKQLQVSMF